MGWLDKKWNWKRNRVVFLCDHPFLIRKNLWFLDESIKTKLPTMLISCSFLSLISAALVHFPSTRVGPTSLGKVTEKCSTGLCRSLHYSSTSGFDGRCFVWSPLLDFLGQNVYNFHGWLTRFFLGWRNDYTRAESPKLSFVFIFLGRFFESLYLQRNKLNNLRLCLKILRK